MISCPPKTAVICPRPSTDRQDGKPQTAMTQDYLLVPPGKAMARLALPAGSPTSHARIQGGGGCGLEQCGGGASPRTTQGMLEAVHATEGKRGDFYAYPGDRVRGDPPFSSLGVT